MYGITGEDDYWERRREERENLRNEDEPVYEDGSLFLDEEIEQIEAQWGHTMAELKENDLLDIVEERAGIVAEAAAWNPRFDCIEYRYIAA